MHLSDAVAVVGGTQLQQVSQSVADTLSSTFGIHIVDRRVTVFYRAEVNGVLVYSQLYAKVTKRNSYTILYDSLNFGLVQYFALVGPAAGIAVIKKLEPVRTTPSAHFNLDIPQLNTAISSPTLVMETEYHCIKIESIKEICLYIDFTRVKYVVRFTQSSFLD